MTGNPNLDDVMDDLEDASDGDLIRVVHLLDAEAGDVENGRTLTHQAQAILELDERGYVVDGSLEDVEVRDTEETILDPEDVEDYRGGG